MCAPPSKFLDLSLVYEKYSLQVAFEQYSILLQHCAQSHAAPMHIFVEPYNTGQKCMFCWKKFMDKQSELYH